MSPSRKILLSPGPATTTETVKRALVVSDICPREEEFGRVVAKVRSDLLAIAGASPEHHTAVLVAGPGTAAVEAVIGSLVPRAGRILILENGAYGARATAIARVLGVDFHAWRMPWTEPPSASDFAAQVRGSSGPFSHALWVHHETTTGMLNPLREFGEICRRNNIVSIVDAMSSFAGVPLQLGLEPIDVLISSSGKCLQGMAGIGIVLASKAAMAASAGIARSVALNLHEHERSLLGGEFPFTPPVQVVYALAQATAETLAETVAGRAARYRANYEVSHAGMTSLGFEAVLRNSLHSGLVTAYHAPERHGFTFKSLHDGLYSRGFTLYPGKIPGADSFRVANIGDLRPDDLRAFVAAVAEVIHG
jgi:2-aminoethylphosphonate aminotransferase